MALLLETNLGGDLVIDLDVKASPLWCRNLIKLAKARYFTHTLIYNVQPNQYCQCGDPTGTGKGGVAISALLSSSLENNNKNEATTTKERYLHSQGQHVLTTQKELRQPGRIIGTSMGSQGGRTALMGSQFTITLGQGESGHGLENFFSSSTIDQSEPTEQQQQQQQVFVSLGQVTEDSMGILQKINASYCDLQGRPYADIRIVRAIVLHDPFDDGNDEFTKQQMDELLTKRGVVVDPSSKHEKEHVKENDNESEADDNFHYLHVVNSPNYSDTDHRPPQETVERRIQAHELDTTLMSQDKILTEEEEMAIRQKEAKHVQEVQDKSRAVVLEMLGDLPSADIKVPEHALFVCKLNPVTQAQDLELIFSRFDTSVKVDIIRDQETGKSLQYGFIEFSSKEACAEAYLKMNNTLIDDRRIRVDFSQSVSKIWNKYTQQYRNNNNNNNRSGGGDGGTANQVHRRDGGRTNRGNDGPPRGFERGYERRDRGGGHHHQQQRRHDARPHERDFQRQGGGHRYDRENNNDRYTDEFGRARGHNTMRYLDDDRVMRDGQRRRQRYSTNDEDDSRQRKEYDDSDTDLSRQRRRRRREYSPRDNDDDDERHRARDTRRRKDDDSSRKHKRKREYRERRHERKDKRRKHRRDDSSLEDGDSDRRGSARRRNWDDRNQSPEDSQSRTNNRSEDNQQIQQDERKRSSHRDDDNSSESSHTKSRRKQRRHDRDDMRRHKKKKKKKDRKAEKKSKRSKGKRSRSYSSSSQS